MAATYAPIRDVAGYFNVSVSTIRNWVRQGRIPEDTYIKEGETYRFNLESVEDALLRAKTTEQTVENDNDN